MCRSVLRKIAVCDDVEVERFVLKRQLMSYFRLTGAKAEIREYVSGESLLADIEEGYIWPDLIFLDIYMGNLNGMDTARHLREMDVEAPIVFLTASPDYAVESYEVEAAGYLLKPAREQQTHAILQKLLGGEAPQAYCSQVQETVCVILTWMIWSIWKVTGTQCGSI